MAQALSLYYLFLLLHFVAQPRHLLVTAAGGAGGSWQLLENIGIVAMHMQLLNNDRVVIFDRTDFGLSNLSLPNGECRHDASELVVKYDCTAHSVEYDVATNTFRPLNVLTDVWCSSGAVMSDGRLIQTGGFNDGDHVVRLFSPCSHCNWIEISGGLKARRWYATNHILPDGRQIVIGGRKQFNYEYYPKNSASNVYSLPFLAETSVPKIENNLYPFVFLNVDGHLFIFANNRAILFDHMANKVVRKYPTIPGGDPRSYPSTGSAVLLPLKNLGARNIEAEVLVCGGAPKDSFPKVSKGEFVRALDTCGRLKITDPNPRWVMETMPLARAMGDMILLPNGHVLIINGAERGTAGWEYGRNPVLNPVLYRPDNKTGSRFEIQKPSNIPRMYHSTAILLRDGRILVGGSNPHVNYVFKNVVFPTELRLEAFNPQYLDPKHKSIRPTIISPASKSRITYTKKLVLRFKTTGSIDDKNQVKVTMVAPSFTTHSFAMNQRLLVLGSDRVRNVAGSVFEIEVMTPASAKLAPPGFYMVFLVYKDIPSEGIWVHLF